MKALLRASELQKRYGKNPVLVDVNFSLKKGEIVGLLGANGAGKTTLMKICVNLLAKNSGSLSLLGYDPEKHWQHLYKDVRILLEPRFPGYLTGREWLIETAILQEADLAEVEDLLKLVGLSSAKYKKIKHYSFGMQQRLGLAAALIGQPKLVILDEPFVGLDPEGISKLQHVLKEKAHQGMTFLISSHQLDELKRIADRILFLNDGKIQKEFSVAELEHTVNVRIKTENNPRAMEHLIEQFGKDVSFRLQGDSIYFSTSNAKFVEEIVRLLSERDLQTIELDTEKFDLRDLFGGVDA